MITKEMIAKRAKELSNLYWYDEEVETGWHWDNSGQEYKDDFNRMAKFVLEQEILARIDELRKYVPYILKDGEVHSKVERIMELEYQLKSLRSEV